MTVAAQATADGVPPHAVQVVGVANCERKLVAIAGSDVAGAMAVLAALGAG